MRKSKVLGSLNSECVTLWDRRQFSGNTAAVSGKLAVVKGCAIMRASLSPVAFASPAWRRAGVGGGVSSMLIGLIAVPWVLSAGGAVAEAKAFAASAFVLAIRVGKLGSSGEW